MKIMYHLLVTMTMMMSHLILLSIRYYKCDEFFATIDVIVIRIITLDNNFVVLLYVCLLVTNGTRMTYMLAT